MKIGKNVTFVGCLNQATRSIRTSRHMRSLGVGLPSAPLLTVSSIDLAISYLTRAKEIALDYFKEEGIELKMEPEVCK